MATYSWKRQKTKYFGEVFFPYADVGLRTRDGRFRRLAFLVDSGAVNSLLRRSTAQTLGLELETGRKISLRGVGGGETAAYVHEIETRFDEGIQFSVPYAIAETENVPNLLGRNGVFDRLQIDLDASVRETRISAPWLTDDRREILTFLNDTEQHILARWNDLSLGPEVDEAARRFVQRASLLVATATRLMKLHCTYASPLIVRALFELAVQFEYLMQDPEARAKDYLDFAKITKFKRFRAIVENPTGPIGRTLANDARREAAEPQLMAECESVRGRFLRKGNRVWDKWYRMTVRDLAGSLGFDAEYRQWYAIGCDWAHADPSSSDWDSLFSPRALFVVCFHYYASILLRVADAKKIVLSSEQHEVLRKLSAEFA